MTWQAIAADIFIAVGVAIELLCSLGLLVMDDAYDRLHYLGPATLLGPAAIAVAVICVEALSTAGIKAILIAVVLAGASPILGHVTARAGRVLQHGAWPAQPEEHIEEL